MSGQPFRRRFDKRLVAEAEALGLEPDDGLSLGETYFFGRVAAGVKMGDLAEQLGVSRPWLYTWMKSGGRRAERERAYAEAKRFAAEYHAEAAGQVLEAVEGDPTSAQVSLAGRRSDYHRWMAEVKDRETFGPKGQEVNLQIDLGQLHIQALTEVAGEWEDAPVEVVTEPEPVEALPAPDPEPDQGDVPSEVLTLLGGR